MSQTTPTSGGDERRSRTWLWLGLVSIATTLVCLGLTIASMTVSYNLTNESTELARGILGSLRYMIVGLPALLVGIIALIVAYIQRRR